MSCFPDSGPPISAYARGIAGLDRVAIRHVHVGAWEQSEGAQCPHCHAFSCPRVYYGVCKYEELDYADCPCGCENLVNEAAKTSYAYDYMGVTTASGKTECVASIWPPGEINSSLFKGQKALGEKGTKRYSYLIMESGGELVGVLFYDDEPISYVGEQGQVGTLIGFLHGDMMRHAVGYPRAFRIRAEHFRTAGTV